jgi:hypothetical protein
VVLVAPDEADALRDPFQFTEIIQQLGPMARDTRVVAEALRAKHRVGAAVAEADHGDPAVASGLFLDFEKRVAKVGLARLDAQQARLAARRGALVVAPERAGRLGAPEKIRRRRHEAARHEVVGDCAHVRIHAVDR